MFACYDDSKIIGYYLLSLQDDNECELNNLCVLPQYRHKHIGTKLLEDAYTKAKEKRFVDYPHVENERVLTIDKKFSIFYI